MQTAAKIVPAANIVNLFLINNYTEKQKQKYDFFPPLQAEYFVQI